jgi:hypothetical protein
MSSSSTILEPPRSLALNAFQLICPGSHRLKRIPRPGSKEERLRVEEEIGQAIFQAADFAYVAIGTEISGSETVDVECDFNRNLHLFDLRSWISEQASSQKLNSRFVFGGEIHITGLSGDIEIDGIKVQNRLRLRVTDMEINEPETWVVARHDTRYLVAGSLADQQNQEHSVGEMAERIAGAGPLKGEVLSVSDGNLLIQTKGAKFAVEPSNYTLTVRSSYVRRHRGATTLTKLQIASGSLTATRKRNRYAVKDRYKAVAEAMDQLGWTVAMFDDRIAIIDRAWAEIRIEGGRA